MKKCIWCKCDIPSESVIDFCHKCGLHMFGEKTLAAIIENMEEARDKGDLYQGSVTHPEEKYERDITFQSQENKLDNDIEVYDEISMKETAVNVGIVEEKEDENINNFSDSDNSNLGFS